MIIEARQRFFYDLVSHTAEENNAPLCCTGHRSKQQMLEQLVAMRFHKFKSS